jgi:Tol biopolymer transport system component
MPAGVRFAFWARSGHRLYLVGNSSVEVWTPEAGAATVPGTIAWTLQPNFSPDGSQLAFTAVTSKGIRIYVYDFKTKASRLLTSKPRSVAMFVKPGWVWYLEEKPCVASSNSVCFDPTQPDGNVLAMNLATGQESRVTFATGDAPVKVNWTYVVPGDVWPLG